MNELMPCPFCGTEVKLEKIPLWHGSHGYHGCYKFEIECKNCGARPNYQQNDTIYRNEEEAKTNTIKSWNRRANDETDRKTN